MCMRDAKSAHIQNNQNDLAFNASDTDYMRFFNQTIES